MLNLDSAYLGVGVATLVSATPDLVEFCPLTLTFTVL